MFYPMNQYYDGVVDRHMVNMQFYSDLSVVPIPTELQELIS